MLLSLLSLTGLLSVGPLPSTAGPAARPAAAANPTQLPTPRREYALAAGAATTAVGSPDGRLLLIAGATADITVFQVRTGLPLRVYGGHRYPITDAAFSAGRDTVVSADVSGEVCVWNVETRTTLGTWRAPGAPAAVRVAPDGRSALIVLGTGAVWRWNLRRPATAAVPLPASAPALPAGARVTAVGLNPAGTRVALGLATGAVVVLDVATGKTQTEKLFAQPVTGLALVGADSVLAVAGTPEIECWQPNQPVGAVARVTRLALGRPAATLATHPA
ncbi:MAG: hypothetical protein H7330_07675, partial [Hymenobacteraceae bacterium]|nr:hypothetical protein [Hymenobacteraceae bacterium]